jgi:hypothetical protein
MFRLDLVVGLAATALLGAFVYLVSVPNTQALATTPHPTGDATCSGRAWPYYEQACLRDLRQPANRARVVRVVFADRAPAGSPADQVARRFALIP